MTSSETDPHGKRAQDDVTATPTLLILRVSRGPKQNFRLFAFFDAKQMRPIDKY